MGWGKAVILVLMGGAQAAWADDLALRPAIGGGTTFIQLTAEHSEREAAHAWLNLVRLNGGLLDDFTPQIAPVTLPHKGRLYRLRAGPTNAANAADICHLLTARGFACLVVR